VFVLIDAGATREAVDLLDSARQRADPTAPGVLRAWLAVAHGEALAAHGERTASLYAFDQAAELLPDDPADEWPYVALDAVHLARWRGHALARFGDPEATAVLTDALKRLDPSFVRAETALRVDLATALAATGDRDEAHTHAHRADRLAAQVGSARQRRRIKTILATVPGNRPLSWVSRNSGAAPTGDLDKALVLEQRHSPVGCADCHRMSHGEFRDGG
jgi:tetratricopeptide (TPR) repeat protein